ncbi:UNVERIFIED_CONTAM: hypothetical protein PYX00_002843 [Menopon gallinae]|uniref:Carboxypeptidase n=1 Tax=Menopon gallinae TaxID=328185 RepID=A0AAW2HXL5_9NEOP
MSLLVLLLITLGANAFHAQRRGETLYFNDRNAGEKLILTPYIKSGQIDTARKLAQVPPLVGSVQSYSGFLTVDDESCDSNMFFWFFPASRKWNTAPVAVWLQGGPGASSLYGLFDENGPYGLTAKNEPMLRNYSWHEAASVVYIDNPVGTGFSYSKLECYSQNQTHVGRNLLSAVKQIMALFPEIKSNPFFVTGESYAGKYVPALSYAIHKDNQISQTKINLQGLAIGNGLVDPGNQLHYSDYLYQLGLIDSRGKGVFAATESKCRKFIAADQWTDAYHCFDSLLNGDKTTGKTYFYNVTGFEFYFNYLHNEQPPEGNIDELLKLPEVRKAIHVGNSPWNNGTFVQDKLMNDMMQSVAPWLEELLEHYRVLIYNGQLDIIVAYPLTEAYLKKLKWSAAKKYGKAERHLWRVGPELAGYAKVAGNLTEIMVRNAGHMVPADQPKWAFDLISRFISNKSYF